jgi:hypothetical protein
VTQEYSISKNNSPVALPAGNWSVRIANFPLLTSNSVRKGNYFGDIVSQLGDVSEIVPVQVNYAADGVDFADTAVPGLGNPQGCSLPVAHTKGIVKVCGLGIEIVNTTASLNLQGLVSMCRMVQPDVETFTSYVALPLNAWGTKSLNPMRTAPKNLSEMALYPGFAQDLAASGYYGPALLKFNRDLHFPISVGALLLDDDPNGGPVNTTTPIECYSSTLGSFAVPGNTTAFSTTRENPLYVPCDTNCIIFSGLSDETTLTLRVRWILERFPNDSEAQLVPISTPTAPFDPVALEIYSRVVRQLPAGVPFGENPAGDWWSKLLSQIGSVVGPMIAMIPHPLAKAAGMTITGASGALGEYGNAKTKRRRQKNKKQEYGPGMRKNRVGDLVPIAPKPGNNVKPIKGPPNPNRRKK